MSGVVHPGGGLRLRIWLACLAGGVAGAAAVLVLLARLRPDDPLYDPYALGIWPWSAALLCLALAVAVGFWLDHGIATHLRGVSRALAAGDPSGLGALPAASGWGELSLLTAQVQSLLVHHRENGHTGIELEDLKQRIRALRVALEARAPGQRVEPLRPLAGVLGPLVETLNRRLAEADRPAAAGREDAAALRRDLAAALADAHESAEQAERGFVEATALLATMRELQRLSGEVQQQVADRDAGPEPGAPSAEEAQRLYREAAAAAIQEMVAASHESLERLAAGLSAVQEIGGHVQVLANRATLIALNATLSGTGPAEPAERPAEGLTGDLRGLAGEVRAVTDLTAERFAVVDREVAAAVERMKGLRERVAARLDQAPPLPGPAKAASDDVPRLLERVRETVLEAAAKGERLAAAGERASRAAERLARRLDEDAAVLERLAERLGVAPEAPAAPEPVPPPGDVRLLGPEPPAGGTGETR